MTDAAPLILTDQEREWLAGSIPADLALQKIVKNHYNEHCVNCGRFIGSHSLKAARKCVRETWEKGEQDA